MSFTGVSNLQKTQIDGLTADKNAINAALATKLETSVYAAKVALLDAADTTHSADIASLQATKLDASTYNTKIAALDLKDAEQDNDIEALQSLVATKVAIDDFNDTVFDLNNADTTLQGRATALENRASDLESNVSTLQSETDILETRADTLETNVLNLQGADTALQNRATALEDRATTLEADFVAADADITALEGRADALEGRATSLENRATALETNITASVQAAIDEKVAITTFNLLADELRDADSALSQSLATKVAATVQEQTDAAQTAAINSKVAQADYDTYVASNDAAVALKANASDLNSYITSNDAAVALKANNSDLQSYITSNDAAVALKADNSALQSYITSNDAAVAARVLTSTYNTKMTALDTLDTNLGNRDYYFERRMLAVDEALRTILSTYTITKPDGQTYAYTASFQNLSAYGAFFTILGKRANGNLVVQFAPWAINTLLGDLRVTVVGGSQVALIVQNNVNPVSRIVDIAPSRALTEADFALTLTMRDSRQTTITATSLTFANYNGLNVMA